MASHVVAATGREVAVLLRRSAKQVQKPYVLCSPALGVWPWAVDAALTLRLLMHASFLCCCGCLELDCKDHRHRQCGGPAPVGNTLTSTN